MPIKSIPKEIRKEYERIIRRLKEDSPNMSDKSRAKLAWSIIKKRYYKDPKDGKWKLKDKVKGSIGEDIETYMDLHIKKEEISAMKPGENKNLIEIIAKGILLKDEPEFVKSIDLKAAALKSGIEEEIPFTSEDNMYIKLDLAHSEPYENNNRYMFSADDLFSAVEQGQFEPGAMVMVDVNHQYIPYGTVLKGNTFSKDLPQYGEVTALETYIGVWAWRFPGLAEEIRALHEAGQLEFSMACTADGVRCGLCGERFNSLEDACEHILNKEATIHVIGPHFKAASIIIGEEKAADVFARSKEMLYKSKKQKKQEKAKAQTQEPTQTQTPKPTQTQSQSKNWSRSFVNHLPDESFALVLSGGERDDSGKTTPKRLRILPHHLEGVSNPLDHNTVDIEQLFRCLRELRTLTALSVDERENIKRHLDNHVGELLSQDEYDRFVNNEDYKAFAEKIAEDLEMSDIEKLQKRIDELESALSEANSAIEDYKSKDKAKELKDVQAKVEELESQLETSNSKIEELNESLNTASGEKDGLSAKVTEMQEKIDELETAKAGLEEKINESKKEDAEKEAKEKHESRMKKIDTVKDIVKDEEKIEKMKEKYAVVFNEESGELEASESDESFNSYMEAMEIGYQAAGGKVQRSKELEGLPPKKRSPETGETGKIDKLFEKI